MEKKEKKAEKISDVDAVTKDLMSLRGTPLPTDTEPIREYINLDNEFRELFKKLWKK